MSELLIYQFPSEKVVSMETGQVIAHDLSILSDDDLLTYFGKPLIFGLPFAYIGLADALNPDFISMVDTMVFPILAVLAYGLGVKRETRMSKIIFHNLYYGLGKKPSKETPKTILKTQKSLGKGESVFIPLNELEGYKVGIEIPGRTANLGVNVGEHNISLSWQVTKNAETSWDDSIDDLVDIYSLRTASALKMPGLKQLSQGTDNKTAGSRSKRNRFKKFLSENRFISIQRIN